MQASPAVIRFVEQLFLRLEREGTTQPPTYDLRNAQHRMAAARWYLRLIRDRVL